MIFEGKYEKGQKIEGKEYKNNKLYFIGQYKDNLKYKGELLNKRGNLLFEGQFNKGLFWTGKFYFPNSYKYNKNISGEIKNGYGMVKEYDYNCFLSFKGEYKNGKRFCGIEYNKKSKKIFKGEYKYDNLKWNGSFYSPNNNLEMKITEGNGKNIEEYDMDGKLIFKGEYKNGRRFNGKGKEYYKQKGKIKFEGKYKDFIYHEGIYYNIKGYKEYEGLFKNGNRQEILLFQEKNKLDFTFFYGQIKEGKKYYGIEINGVGAFIGKFDENENFYNGRYFQGDFDIEEKKQLYEEGNLKALNIKEIEKKGKLKFEGQFKYQELQKCFYKKDTNEDIEYYKNGSIKFEGTIKNGEYCKGKEYYEASNDEDMSLSKLKFEGLYKEGKKYKGWEYNLQGSLIFVGEYKSGLYWNGYFYGEGELTNQNKTGEIKQGNGYNIKLYDHLGSLLYEGEFKQGKYYNGKGKLKEKELIIIKDITQDKSNDKNILNEIYREGIFKDGELFNGREINKYIVNEQFIYEREFKGDLKEGKYYKGKEIIYHKRGIEGSKSVRLERDYLNGRILNVKYY